MRAAGPRLLRPPRSRLAASRRLPLPVDDLPPEFFEKHPVAAEAEVVSRRLRAPDVVQLCVGMAAVQQLVQICQHRAEVIVIPIPKRRRRQALERFQFRALGVDTPDELFELFRNLHVQAPVASLPIVDRICRVHPVAAPRTRVMPDDDANAIGVADVRHRNANPNSLVLSTSTIRCASGGQTLSGILNASSRPSITLMNSS